MDTIVIILALCGGALLSVQAAINGRLGSQVGCCAAPFNLRHRRAGDGIADPVFAPATSVNLLQVPKWQLLGALRRALHRHYGAGGAADRHRYGYRGGDLWPADDEPADRQLWLAGQQHDGVLAGATGGGDMSGPRAVLNLHLREVGYLPRGGPRRTVSCADASGIVNIA